MYWNINITHRHESGFCWTITLNVLKYANMLDFIKNSVCWTITLNVLKWVCISKVNVWSSTLNHNIKCIEIEYASDTAWHTKMLNHNIKCIEIHQTFRLYRYFQVLNHNIKCIEIELIGQFSGNYRCWTITLNVLK